MYNNLYKRGAAGWQQTDARVIDTNELVSQRIDAITSTLHKKENTTNAGFVQGLFADEVEISTEGDEGNRAVIKVEQESNYELASAEYIDSARQEANDILQNAHAEAEEILQMARSQAEKEKNMVFEAEKKRGYQIGNSEAQKQIELMQKQIQQKEQALEMDYKAKIDALEPEFVKNITDIYQHIFKVDLSSNRNLLLTLLNSAMKKIEAGKYFVVHVSQDDYPYINMHKKQFLESMPENINIDIVEDATLHKNEGFIETENGIYDCGLGTQLEELQKKLMLLSYSNK